MQLDKERIESYLHQIASELTDLENVLESDNKEILADRNLMKSLKYSVIVIAEAVAGVLQHILAKQYNISIEGYTDVLVKSSQNKVVSDSLLDRLKPFVIFRNMLVHQYWRVKDDVFLTNLRSGLKDFHELISEISEIQRTKSL